MLTSVAQPDLAAALRIVAMAVGRGHLPIMSGVRLEARGDELVVTACGTELSIAHRLPAIDPGVGTVIVPAKLLDRFVADVAGPVELSLEGDDLRVVAGNSRLLLRTMAVDGIGPD